MTTDYAFLHGGGQGGWVWHETLAALERQYDSEGYRAIAFDLPGCGQKRGQDTSTLTTRDVANAFVSDLADSGLQQVILVGHSNAGTILPLAAEMRPDLIRRLVYVSCIAPAEDKSVSQTLGSGLQGSNPDEIGWPVDPASLSDPSELFRHMFCNDMSDDYADRFLARLGRDHWPTESALTETGWRYDHLEGIASTYVLCLRDCILPLAWQEKLATRLKVDRRVRIDAGHQAMNTRPHTLAEILRLEAES